MAEERSKVGARPLVVHVVSRCATQKTKRHQVVQGPWQVVAYVVLYRHPDAVKRDAPCGERVSVEENRVQVAPEAHRHQLWDAELLCGPGERCHVLMVGCVNPAVEQWVLVVYVVPNEVLGVKEEKYGQAIGKHLMESGSFPWHYWCRQDEHANKYSWEDKEDVVVQSGHEALSHHFQCWLPVLLDLVLVEEGHSFSQKVQNSKRYTEEEVA